MLIHHGAIWIGASVIPALPICTLHRATWLAIDYLAQADRWMGTNLGVGGFASDAAAITGVELPHRAVV